MGTPRLRPLRRPTATAILAVAVAVLVTSGCSGGSGGDEADPATSTQTAVEVTVPADGLDLAGTLRLPAGSGPHPGIVIAHGSGPQGRRGLAPGQLGLTFPQPVPIYEQLAGGLRDAGFAVLTFDKRSCGPFNGCADNGYPPPPDDLTFDTFVDDVDAVLDDLAQRPEVDRTILIGHSQGGTIAATLAARRDDLDAVVLLATPAVPIDQVLATQADTFAALVDAAGQGDQPAALQAVAELQELADAVATVADGQVEGAAVEGAPRAFWASWIDASRAASERLGSVPAPVLVLGGGSDWNVPPAQVEAWAPVLRERDHLEILPGITHALTRLDVDDPAAITPSDVGTAVDDALLDILTAWLHDHVG